MRFSFRTFLFLFAALGCLPLVTQAQTEGTSTASSTSGFFNTVIENVQSITNNVAEQVTPNSQSPLGLRTEERLTNLAANITNRLEGFTDRLFQISSRLKRRIEKLKQEGYEVAAAESSLSTANEHLEAARRELSTIDRDVYRTFRSSNPKKDWLEVRAKFLRTRDTIKLAHGELRNTLVILKGAQKIPTSEVASSTPTTTE